MEITRHSIGKDMELVEGFRTGIVRAKYYNPDSTGIDGEEIEITVIGCSSQYTFEEKPSERVIVINHTKVTICNQNEQP